MPRLHVVITPDKKELAKLSPGISSALCGEEAVVVSGAKNGEMISVRLCRSHDNTTYTLHFQCCYYARRENTLPSEQIKGLPSIQTSLVPVSLPNLLLGHVQEVAQLRAELCKRGWAVISLDAKLAKAVQMSMKPPSFFF